MTTPAAVDQRRQAQNAVLDAIASGIVTPATSRGTPQSLRPDSRLLAGVPKGSLRANAIVEAWKFRFPVTMMSPEQLKQLSDRCTVLFTGSASELR